MIYFLKHFIKILKIDLQNVNIKVKSKCKWFFVLYIEKIRRKIGVVFTELWMKRILVLMQLKDFQHIRLRGGMKNCFYFSLFKKDNWQLKAVTGSCSVKKVFWGVFLPRNMGVLDSSKSGLTDKIRCSLKICLFAWDIVMFSSIIWRTNSKHLWKMYGKNRCPGKDLHIFLG